MSLREMLENRHKYHLGHLVYHCFKEKKDLINQIDGSTGENETNASVLARSSRLASWLRRRGFKPGDVLALGGRNHLDLHIPYYAALMTGLPIAGVDPTFKYVEIEKVFELTRPAVVFCDEDQYEDVRRANEALGLRAEIVTFGRGELGLSSLLEACEEDEDFRPSEFDGSRVFAWLISTSGTTGGVKFAAFDHHTVMQSLWNYKDMLYGSSSGGQQETGLNLSPVQWITGFFNPLSMPLSGVARVQTPAAPADVRALVATYRPVTAMLSPSVLHDLLHPPCDLSCFKVIVVGGMRAPPEVLLGVRKAASNAFIMAVYGMTECLGAVFRAAPDGPVGNCGARSPFADVKLVNPETNEEITEPNKPGELWVKSAVQFKEYYNMPEATAASLADGWYRSGDLLYRDEGGFWFFHERIKLLIKYRSTHIVPGELEAVLERAPGVAAAAVTSVPDPACGELPAAAIVRAPGRDVSAEEIQLFVSEHLSDAKQLRGGVVFVPALPLTSTGKVARVQLRDLVRRRLHDPRDQ